jgi:hypothetical protein
LYKVQEDLHEVVSNATENSLQALFWVWLLWVCVDLLRCF